MSGVSSRLSGQQPSEASWRCRNSQSEILEAAGIGSSALRVKDQINLRILFEEYGVL